MNTKTVDGLLFTKMVCGGYDNLKLSVEEINGLNVFPIPDGDTGDNMCSTMSGGTLRVENDNLSPIGTVANEIAKGMLLGARGNSGVILSQFFAGIAKGLENTESADVYTFGNAIKKGVDYAYNSVAVPVEGTMLTVIKDASNYANGNINEDSTLESFCDDFLTEAEKSLERTPELLSVLKEAGVIDSGGAGVCKIAKGFVKILHGENIDKVESVHDNKKELDFSLFTEDSVMKYGYCTEFLLQLQKSKINVEAFSVDELIGFLKTVGDSIVAFRTGSIIKVHVHTLTPGAVLSHCQQFGEFLTLKIENMTLQHNEVIGKKKAEPKPHKKYAVVAVATGEGMMETFKELGTDYVINGGQGNNPSTEQFLQAFNEIDADNIFVLPNNSNIIMVANQAKQMYDKANVVVIPTKNIGDGYSALSTADFNSENSESVEKLMLEGISTSDTAMIVKAVRDAYLNEVDIKEGAYIGFRNKEMLCSNADRIETVFSALQKMGAEDKDFLVVFYGKNISIDEKAQFESRIKNDYPLLEFYGIQGDQEDFDYVVILR